MRKLFSAVLFLFLFFITSLAFPQRRVVAASCGGLVPNTPENVSLESGPGIGEITLYWETARYANRYAVAYGTSSGNYLYGADNIGGETSRSYTVKGLTPGARYYFKITANRDSCSSPFSREVSGIASAVSVGVSPEVKKAASKPRIGKPVISVSKADTTISALSDHGVNLAAIPGPKVGEVTLSWQQTDSADNYHLVYGTSSQNYQYGALNIGKTNNFTVKSLVPGKLYYFAVVPVFNGQPLYTSAEAKAWAAVSVSSPEVVKTTPEALIQPKYEPKVQMDKEKSYLKDFEDINGKAETPVVASPSPIATSSPKIAK